MAGTGASGSAGERPALESLLALGGREKIRPGRGRRGPVHGASRQAALARVEDSVERRSARVLALERPKRTWLGAA